MTVGELKTVLNDMDDDTRIYIIKTKQGPEQIDSISYTRHIDIKTLKGSTNYLEIHLKK